LWYWVLVSGSKLFSCTLLARSRFAALTKERTGRT
jgi:hypothetical protein